MITNAESDELDLRSRTNFVHTNILREILHIIIGTKIKIKNEVFFQAIETSCCFFYQLNPNNEG